MSERQQQNGNFEKGKGSSFPSVSVSAAFIFKCLAIGFSVVIGIILFFVAFSFALVVVLPAFLIGAAITLWQRRKSLSFHKIRSFFRRSPKKHASNERVPDDEYIDV